MNKRRIILSEKIYNTIIVLDNFCKNNQEYEEIQNISPIVEFIKDTSDELHVELTRWNK